MKKALFSATVCVLLIVALVLSASAATETVSEEMSYSLVTPASDAYPDDEIKLTDGIFGTIPEGGSNYYSSGAYVGFSKDNLNENGNFVIILDLGMSYSNLTEFTIGYLNETSVGVRAPKSVSFAVSDDRNGEYTDLGSLNTEKTDPEATASTYADTLETENTSGQYVRVTITPSEFTNAEGATQPSNWTFIDEISIRTTTDDESSTEDSSDISTEPESSEPESSEPESSEPESSELESSEIESSDLTESDESEELSTPQTGDDGMSGIAFTFLALAAVSMAAALFINLRRKEEF